MLKYAHTDRCIVEVQACIVSGHLANHLFHIRYHPFHIYTLWSPIPHIYIITLSIYTLRIVQFYIVQDSAKADSSTWAVLMHLTFVNDKGEEVTRSVPTNGTAEYAALSANTVTSYYCQRLPQGKNSCAELTPYVPTVNNTCKRSAVYDFDHAAGPSNIIWELSSLCS